MTTQALQTLDHDQFQAAAKAARDRFAMLKAKRPTLKGYLVLSGGLPDCRLATALRP